MVCTDRDRRKTTIVVKTYGGAQRSSVVLLSYPKVEVIVGNHEVKLEDRIWEDMSNVRIHTFGSDKASHSPDLVGSVARSVVVFESSSIRLRARRISSLLNQPGRVVSGKSGRIKMVQKATMMVREPSI